MKRKTKKRKKKKNKKNVFLEKIETRDSAIKHAKLKLYPANCK